MSEARQKFESLAHKGSAGIDSTKAVHIEEALNTKENIQNAGKALKDGRLPTTGQITEFIDSIRDVKLRQGVEISSTGQNVSEKIDQTLESTKRLIRDKNMNNEIQNLIHHSKFASLNLEVNADSKDAKEILKRSYYNLVILAQLIVRSGEFRGLLGDLYNLIRDILKESDLTGSENLPSSDERLSKLSLLDQSRFEEAYDRIAAEVRDQSDIESLPESHQSISDNKVAKNTNEDSDLISKAIQKIGQNLKPIVDKASTGDINLAKRNDKEKTEEVKRRTEECLEEKQIQAGEIKNDLITKTKEQLSQTNKAIKNVGLDQDNLEILAGRLTGIIDEVQSHPNYQKALEGLFDVIYNIKYIVDSTKDNIVSNVEDSDLIETVINAKKAVENFAGHYSLDKLIQLVKEFSKTIESDEKLKNLMHSNYEFILKAFRNRDFIHDDEFDTNAIDHFNTSRRYLLNSCESPVKSILLEANNFVTALKEDPITNNTIRDLESLTKELFLDDSGKPTIKYELLQDFQRAVPILAKRLQRLEIPRVCKQDDKMKCLLDNISLICDDITPRNVRIRTDTEFDTEEETISNIVNIKLQGIHAKAQDVAFYFNKKILLGSIEDSGVVNIAIDGSGLDIFLRLSPKPIRKNSVTDNSNIQSNFTVLESKCRINNIGVKLEKTNHDLVYKMFNKAIQTNIKHEIESVVSKGIRDFFEGIDNIISSDSEPQKTKPSTPLDSRPDGWKSRAFEIQN